MSQLWFQIGIVNIKHLHSFIVKWHLKSLLDVSFTQTLILKVNICLQKMTDLFSENASCASHVAPSSSDHKHICIMSVRRSRSVRKGARRQCRGRVESPNEPSRSNAVRPVRTRSRNRGGLAQGKGANRHSLSRQDDGIAGFEYLINEEEYRSWITLIIQFHIWGNYPMTIRP